MRLGKISYDDLIDALIWTVWIVWSRATRPQDFFIGKNVWDRGDFLAGGPPATTWFDELSKNCSASFELMFQTQHGSSDGPGLGAGDADHSNAATTRRGGNGDDGVVEIHREIVAGEGTIRG